MLNSEFSFSKISGHGNVKDPSVLYHLLMAEFIPFPWVLVLSEMQIALSRI